MRPHLVVDLVPGDQGGFQPTQISGQLFHLIELLIVGAEGTLYPAIALRKLPNHLAQEGSPLLAGQAGDQTYHSFAGEAIYGP